MSVRVILQRCLKKKIEESLTLSRFETLIDGPGCPNCGSVDSPVEEEHHEHGNVEGTQS